MTSVTGRRDSGDAVRTMRSDAQRNDDVLIRAATAAIHREGVRVPMGTIAADAGVGVGTLYRHFPTREALLAMLTHRSFEQLLENATEAERTAVTPVDALRRFVTAAIRQRNELILPLHGGPQVTQASTRAVQRRVHQVLQRVLDNGRADGTLKDDLTPRDVFAFGALLAQPHPPDRAWDATCRRLLDHYLDGLIPR